MADDINIALIDDDEAVLDSLRLYLESKRIKVSPFTSAEDFLKADFGERPPDCVVADVRMPGLSGIDLVQRMASDRNLLPIILITAHGDIDMAVAAIKLGAFDFIEKPFDEKRLLTSIQEAVDGVRQARDESAELQELRAR